MLYGKKLKKIINNKDWFNTFENDNKMIEDWFVIDRIYIYIYILFNAYNRKKFLKIIGWKIYLPNFIPRKDIQLLFNSFFFNFFLFVPF